MLESSSIFCLFWASPFSSSCNSWDEIVCLSRFSPLVYSKSSSLKTLFDVFWQSKHRQNGLHLTPISKHSQYFFTHFDFRHWQPLFCWIRSSFVFDLNAFGFFNSNYMIICYLNGSLSFWLWQSVHVQFIQN